MRAEPRRVGHEDPLRHRRVVQLVVILCTLAAIIAGIAMSLLTGPQSP